MNEIVDIDLYRLIYDIVEQVPPGFVTTYGAVARALGDVRGARAVGRAMHLNPRPKIMPCHRVVSHDGSLGGFGLGISKKVEYLEEENIFVDSNGFIEDFEDRFFDDFEAYPILDGLRAQQEELNSSLVQEGKAGKYLVGLDIHYPIDGVMADRRTGLVSENAWAAAVVYDTERRKVVGHFRSQGSTRFPYIPGYLAFREMPIYNSLMPKVRLPEDAVLVFDGNGIMHPRRMGIAAHAGLLLNKRTIGVAKSRMLGTLDMDMLGEKRCSPVMVDGQKVGWAYRYTERIRKPVFISPGTGIGVDESFEAIKPHFRYRIPTPVREAHMIAPGRSERKK